MAATLKNAPGSHADAQDLMLAGLFGSSEGFPCRVSKRIKFNSKTRHLLSRQKPFPAMLISSAVTIQLQASGLDY